MGTQHLIAQRFQQLLGFILILCAVICSGTSIGVSYDSKDSTLPSPKKLVELLMKHDLLHVRLLDANPIVLEALSGTGIEVAVGMGYKQAKDIGKSKSRSALWLKKKVMGFMPDTLITSIIVNHQGISEEVVSTLVPAMKAIYSALVDANLDKRIKVTTTLSASLIKDASSVPPSSSTKDLRWVLHPLLAFLSKTGSFLILNADFDRDFAHREEDLINSVVVAASNAMAFLHYPDIPIVINDQGLPSEAMRTFSMTKNLRDQVLAQSMNSDQIWTIIVKMSSLDISMRKELSREGEVLFRSNSRFSKTYNSKLKGHIEQSSQELVEKSETGPKLMMIEEISREKLGKESGLSASATEKVVEDPYFLTLNDVQQSATLQEFPRPKESSTVNEIDKNERLCQPDGRDLGNEYNVNFLKCTEPMTVGHKVADNTTSGPKFVNSATGKMVSCNDGAVPLDLNQVKAVVNQHPDILTEESLIREAEEADISKDREALLKKEAELLAMKEENLRRKEKIQAELEAEKEAMQAGVDEEMAFLRQEELDLRAAQKKNERNAESVTGEMFAECQELLQIFGLPYIIAPMEAEAQCAFMELVHLVDGVVTDDCDAFLFGAGTVYKNIFDERKYVETYLMKDVEEELGLNREKLVRMALLLGSDYTEGISGIGIVNAIEVVNAFPEEDGLKMFREWLDSPDPSILNKVHACSGKSSRKRSLKSSKKTGSIAGEEEEGVIPGQSTDRHEEEELSEEGNSVLKQIFMEKHRAVSKNWHVPESFPNEAVISAYTAPQVDKSTELFSWGRPDLMSLRKLCWEKFGWAKEKADELLLPVLKEYDRHETQLRLEAFYSFNERFAKIRSRRIQKAVTGITGRRSSETMDLPPHLTSTPQKRPRKRKENSISEGSVQDIPGQTMDDARNERVSSDVERIQSNKNRKQERKKKLHNDILEPENTAAKVSSMGRGKGRGRGRGGKGGASRGRGRREGPRSSADHSGSENENEASEQGQLKRKFSPEIVELRKSRRPRKDVNYAPDEQGSDGECHMYNASDNDMSCEISTVKDFQKQPVTSSDSFRKGSEEIDLQTNLENTGIEHLEDVGVQDERLYSDYLATGGGFCAEEENHEDGLHTNKGNENDNAFSTGDSIKCSSSNCVQVGLSNDFTSRDKNLDALFSGGGVGVSEEADCLASDKDMTTNNAKELEFNDRESADVITKIEPRTDNSASAVGLRAIPFLRRKKRNSN